MKQGVFLGVILLIFGCESSTDNTLENKEEIEEVAENIKEEDIETAELLLIPAEVTEKYNTTHNVIVSDEFDGSSLNTDRWYRRKELIKENKRVTEEDRFIELKEGKLVCYGMEGKGGGIVSKNITSFGFYSLKWRVTGFPLNLKSSYHPALWSGKSNGRETLKDNDWTEIDLVEVVSRGNNVVTQADAPCRINNLKINDKTANGTLGEKAIMKSFYNDPLDEKFHIYGMEYTPEYIQVWEVKNNTWQKLGITVVFDDKNIGTVSSIPKKCHSDMFWYLGNLWTGGGDDNVKTTMELDWFRYYELKK